ncbi:hypothetical protein H0H93_001053, partial [Arthromyces matolae]
MPVTRRPRPTVEDTDDEEDRPLRRQPRHPHRIIDDDEPEDANADPDYQPTETPINSSSNEPLPTSRTLRNRIAQDRLCDTSKSSAPARPSPPVPKLNAGERLVPLSYRDERCPKLYEAENHPLRNTIPGGRRVFFYIQDTSFAGMLAAYEAEQSMTIPYGTYDEVVAKGFQPLEPGDALFSRDMWGSGLAEDDVLQAWHTSKGIITPEMMCNALKARDAALGPAHLRTPSVTQQKNGTYIGGTAFQRTDRITRLKSGSCYTLSNSYERPRNKMSPCKDIKMQGAEVTEHQKMRQDLISAVAPIAMASLREGSPEVYTQLEKHASLINTPRIGSDDNFAFPTSQLNIAPAGRAGEASLRLVMSFFGGEHFDFHDNAGYFTNIHVLSDLPENYDPGRFFLLYCGVFVQLSPNTNFSFSGLHYHGGTAPTAPPGIEPAPDAYRFVVVSYPPKGMTSGTTRYSLGALPENEEFVLPPEMINVDNFMDTPTPQCTHATYLADGHLLQTPEQQVSWVARNLLCMSQYFLNQLPKEYDIRLNPDLFLGSVSYMQAGVRSTPKAWEEAPGFRSDDNEASFPRNLSDLFGQDQKALRVAAQQEWERYLATVAGHIPSMVAKKVVPSLHPELQASTGKTGDRPSSGRKASQSKKGPIHRPKASTKRKDPPKSDHLRPRKKRRIDNNKEQAMGSEAPWMSKTFDRLTDAMANASDSTKSTNTSQHRSLFLRLMLDDLNLHTLVEETKKIRQMSDVLRKNASNPLQKQQLTQLESIYGLILDTPTSLDAVLKMRDVWKCLDSLKTSAFQTEITTRWERACIMGTTYAAWYWLDIVLANACEAMIKTGDASLLGGSTSWLARLTKDVENFFVTRMEYREFKPESFSLQFQAPTCALRNRRRSMTNPKDDPKPIVSGILSILRSWLRFPKDQTPAQAWFVHCVLQSFGRNALFLEKLWPAFLKVTEYALIGKKSKGTFEVGDLEPVLEVFCSHPLANSSSQETGVLSELAGHITSLNRVQTDKPTESLVEQQTVKGFVRFLREAYE